MKAISKRATGKTAIEGSYKSNTLIIRFSIDESENSLDVFGIKLSDIPKNKYISKPDDLFCKVKYTINTKENAIKFDSLSLGVDSLGENPYCIVEENLEHWLPMSQCPSKNEANDADPLKLIHVKENLEHWLPMWQCGLNKNEVNEAAIPPNYPRNAIVDGLKVIAYQPLGKRL